MMHIRHRQIKKAEIMSNPLVLFGISFMAPDGKEVFVDSKVMREWQERYGGKPMIFGTSYEKEVRRMNCNGM